MEGDQEQFLMNQIEKLMYTCAINVPGTPKIAPLAVGDPPPLEL